MTQSARIIVKTYKRLYDKIICLENITLAYKNARKGKTKKRYVKEFEENLKQNLLQLQEELKTQTYKPKPLVTFILRDPKTRKISKSDFRDRIVHHAVIQLIEPFFDKSFICDSCANRKEKGTLFAIKRFEFFRKRVTHNFTGKAFCFKADIKHYFQEVNHLVLIALLEKKIKDKQVIWLVKQILDNSANSLGGGGERLFVLKGCPLAT